MRISTRIWLNLAILLSVLAVISVLTGLFLIDLRTSINRSQDYEHTILEAFALSTLVDNYQLQPSIRAEQQLRLVTSSLGLLLNDLSPPDISSRFLIDQIQKNEQQLIQLLDQFITRQSDTGIPIEDEPRKLLAIQIRIKVRYITDDVEQLMNLNQHHILARQKGATITFFALVGLLALSSTLAFRLVNRRIMAGIRRLKDGSDHFSRGQLDYRIELPGHDELSELAQATNHMAESLQNSYAELNRHAKKLEQSNRELEQFAYVASHDLQEPLRKIQAFGSLVRAETKENLSEKGTNYLVRMENAAKRMRDLIDALLEYSRLMRQNTPFTSVDLNTTLSEVVSDLETRITDTQGLIDSTPLPIIQADSVQMRQLFQNILSNSLKYRREDTPPRISISCSAGAGSNGKIYTMKFTDNGIGFEQEYADKIFAPFQRLHGRQQYTGTGIGLAICRMIAERHNGSITAESTPGQGSIFTVLLPEKHVAPKKKPQDSLSPLGTWR